jgi:hypothetical protein
MGKTGSFSEKRVLPLKTAKNGFARRKPVKKCGGKRRRDDREVFKPIVAYRVLRVLGSKGATYGTRICRRSS